ncbi:MAG TPA: type VI secretion system needle protein Hcp [Porphyromonadaceae bacterium]|nr:type VI secretion system needle protein Hcp [Porphyromonadaceae bacterium]
MLKLSQTEKQLSPQMGDFPLAYLEGKFLLDGKTYEIETFKIVFNQPIDYKNQPQHETLGGQLMITLTQAVDNNIYTWAKTSTLMKSGQVLFQTDAGITIIKIDFQNAYCVALSRKTNSQTGTLTTLVISPEIVIMNDVEHNKFWPR